ncbi:MAG: hypothetical protein AAF492_19115, partial [Verrucomicrobiota bacterium]
MEHTGFDTAKLRTGFVVHPRARYNATIYNRVKVADAGPMIPVNQQFTGAEEDELAVIWYEGGTQAAAGKKKENILWPWKPVRYKTKWPDNPGRITIASRLGSEEPTLKNLPRIGSGRKTRVFDPQYVSQVQIYNQPDPTQAGFNPNEEHALVAPSIQLAMLPEVPPAAFALRTGDLNVTEKNVEYTSDPYVLVQYFDRKAAEHRMAVYKIAPTGHLAPSTKVGKPVANKTATNVLKFTINQHGFLHDEAVEVRFDKAVEGLRSGDTYFVDLQDQNTFYLVPRPGASPVKGKTSPVQVSITRLYPDTFEYPMKAGEIVQAPYPLPKLFGPAPPKKAFGLNGLNGNGNNEPRTYWEDHRGQAWAVSGGAPDQPHHMRGYFYYPMRSDFWFRYTANGTTPTVSPWGRGLAEGTILRFLPKNLRNEFAPEHLKDTDYPQEVVFDVVWPDNLPILKVGETLTFAGGEYHADHPQSPGLPGVVGWKAGRVIYDSLNTTMSTNKTFTDYAARLISPL